MKASPWNFLTAIAVSLVLVATGSLPAAAPLGVNVLDYGADPTGVQDSTEALQKACDTGSLVYLPAGTYLYSTLSIKGAVTLQGAGSQSTILKTSNLKENTIEFHGFGWHVKDLALDATAERTGGAHIWSDERNGSIENCNLSKYYIGIDLDGAIGINISNIHAYNGTPASVAEGGALLRLGHTKYTGSINISKVLADVDNITPRQPSTGITIGYADVVSISDTLIIHHTKDLNIVPKDGQVASLIQITNSCFDTAYNGMFIAPAKGGTVLRMGIANTWFGANSSDGIVIDGREGSVKNIQFSNVMAKGNEVGVRIFGTNVDGIYFSNCSSTINRGTNLQVSEGAQRVIWDGGALQHSPAYGFTAEAGCTGRVSNTQINDNALGASLDPTRALLTSGNSPVEWLTYTPTVTATSGTITDAKGTFRYKLDEKTVIFTLKIKIATNGNAAGALISSLPFPAAPVDTIVAGRETKGSGRMLQGFIPSKSTTMKIRAFDNTYPAADSTTLVVSGRYEMR